MNYTVLWDGREYDLPPQTIAINAKVEKMVTLDSTRPQESYKAQFAFVRELLGEEQAKEALGTDSIDAVDLTLLTVLVNRIRRAWLKPIEDDNRQLLEASTRVLDKVVAAADSVKTISSAK